LIRVVGHNDAGNAAILVTNYSVDFRFNQDDLGCIGLEELKAEEIRDVGADRVEIDEIVVGPGD